MEFALKTAMQAEIRHIPSFFILIGNGKSFREITMSKMTILNRWLIWTSAQKAIGYYDRNVGVIKHQSINKEENKKCIMLGI